MAAGAGTVLLPVIAYTVAYLFRFDHTLAAGAMIAVASIELAAVAEFVYRS
jgi:hypothetical protein